jgi:hypothetical protein
MLLFCWWRISDDWLVSRAAVYMFAIAALISCAMTPFIFGLLKINDFGLLSRILWGSAGVLGSLSVFFLWSGMWRYWTRIDESSKAGRRFWFCILIVGVWYGAALYYGLVYVPQVKTHWGNRTEAASE